MIYKFIKFIDTYLFNILKVDNKGVRPLNYLIYVKLIKSFEKKNTFLKSMFTVSWVYWL